LVTPPLPAVGRPFLTGVSGRLMLAWLAAAGKAGGARVFCISPMETSPHRPHSLAFLEQVLHGAAVLVLTTTGVSKLHHPHAYWPVIALCWAAAALILFTMVFHGRIERHRPKWQAGIHLLEAVVITVKASYELGSGKRWVYLFFLAALGYVIAAIVTARKASPQTDPHRKTES
jgi:hypothetical protein